MVAIAITYTAPGLGVRSVATIEDQGLLRQAAQLALEQAEQRAAAAASEDPIMGMLHSAEVRRLYAALSILVPGFGVTPTAAEDLQ